MNDQTRSPDPGLKAQVIHALKWSATGKLLVQLLTWGMTLFVVRLLTPSDYGLMSMATVLTAFLALVSELGLGSAVIQREELSTDLLRKAFGIVLVSNNACAAAVFLAAPYFSEFFSEPRLLAITRVLSAQFVVSSLGVIPNALLVRRMDFRAKTAVDVSTRLLASALTVLLAARGNGVWSLVVGSLAWAGSRSLGYWIASRFFMMPTFSLRGATDILAFGGAVAAQRVGWFLYSQADVFIIGRVLGPTVLGFYSVAVHVASLPMQKFNEVINEVTLRAFSRVRDEGRTVGPALSKSLRILSLGAFPVFFGMSAVAPETVALLFGAEWAAATLPLQLVSLIMPLRMLNTPISEALNAVGRPDVLLGNLAVAIVALPSAIYVGSSHGIVGVCLAWLIAFPIVFAFTTHRAAPHLGLSLAKVARAMAGPAFSSILMYLAVVAARTFLQLGGVHEAALPILILSGVAAYALALRWLCWGDVNDGLAFVLGKSRDATS